MSYYNDVISHYNAIIIMTTITFDHEKQKLTHYKLAVLTQL